MGLAKDYLDKYHSLAVDLPETWGTRYVTLRQYVCGWERAVAPSWALINALRTVTACAFSVHVYTIDQAPEQWSITQENLIWVFQGKGSPGDIATVVAMAYYCDLIRRPLQRYRGATPLTLHQYCDSYLGLDCNGFVSNFLSV
jgi:hypothetical protein